VRVLLVPAQPVTATRRANHQQPGENQSSFHKLISDHFPRYFHLDEEDSLVLLRLKFFASVIGFWQNCKKNGAPERRAVVGGKCVGRYFSASNSLILGSIAAAQIL
jgi:hypothetical protein